MGQTGQNPVKAISRVSITDSVVDSIRELIESGTYQVGEKLPTEASLCEMLSVSRTSVREATRVLQALGYVSLVPGKGAFVADAKPANGGEEHWYDVENVKFYDFMEVRMAIETLAVRLSVERATPKQVKALEKIHASFLQANERQDGLQLIMLDEQFHTAIIEYTDNPLLININKQLLESFRVYRSSSFMDNDVYHNAVVPHSRILLCFQTKNVQQAVEEMRRHLEITTQDMETIYNNQKSKK